MLTQNDSGNAAIDDAIKKFESSIEVFRQYDGQDLSEADTRSKVIDPILSILGWTEPSIEREWHEREADHYLDYKLSTTQPVIIVEAKKAFVRFEIPAGHVRYFRISGAIKAGKNVLHAIEQARHYAYNSGIQYCCITNGFQFIFYRASNSVGVAWSQQMVVVFRDHQDILSRFAEFWDLFSYESASAGRIATNFPLHHPPKSDASRFHRFGSELKVDYEARDRNALFPYTRVIIRQIFQSLDNADASPELLENCYVETARDSSYERGIGELLKEHSTKIPEGSVKLVTTKKHAGQFQAHLETLAQHPSKEGTVTLLLGTVGAGKTTFINRFRKVFAQNLIDAHFVWIQLRFNVFVESQDTVSPWVADQIRSVLQKDYSDVSPFAWDALQQIYSNEIKELRDGVLSPLYKHNKANYEIEIGQRIDMWARDREAHTVRCLRYYAKRTNRQIILIFDNADQHGVALQNEVFLIAQKYATQLGCLAFISLREESFWKNKEYGGLSAFHSTAFQITAPRIEQVLAKRFKYASSVILEDQHIHAEAYVSTALQLTPDQINNVFRTLQNTLLGQDKRFVRFLEYLSPGEVRRSLDFVARFLTSGHTNINRIMDRSRNGITVPVPFHEFLQSVMLGDRHHYREQLSDIVNLYAADGRGDQSHFNRLAVIARVMSAVGDVGEKGKGFVSLTDIATDCESVGLSHDTAMSIVAMLVQRRVLATDTLIRDSIASDAQVRATTAAVYYVNELASFFTYIDNIIIDTEIGRDDARHDLRELSREIFTEVDRFQRLEKRVARARRFVAYLSEEYRESKFAHAGDRFDKGVVQLIPRLVESFHSHTNEVIANARLAFDRPNPDELFNGSS